MSAVNEQIVREYFEHLGFLVNQPCKYVSVGRNKRVEEELDLLVSHPQVLEHVIPTEMIWTSAHLKTIHRAVVGVRGGHSERFYSGSYEQAPEILRYAERSARLAGAARLGGEPLAVILCIPELPVSEELQAKTLAGLRERGVDGVISFRTMLLELVSSVRVNRNYEKSDLLQILRILKAYNIVKDPQLEFFDKRGRKAKAKAEV
ncbi:MAG: hypothetical protein WCI03_06560 [bacterium]|jgi:hypothetical protein